MEAAKRIALLLLGLAGGGIAAQEPVKSAEESPIFVPRAPVVAVLPPAGAHPAQTPVGLQLAALLRSDAEALKLAAPAAAAEPGSPEVPGNTLQLEKMTVLGRRIIEPPVRETALEKFTRTGYLWEFSPTKRFMLGPNGDKVALMFSFDW